MHLVCRTAQNAASKRLRDIGRLKKITLASVAEPSSGDDARKRERKSPCDETIYEETLFFMLFSSTSPSRLEDAWADDYEHCVAVDSDLREM